MLAYLTDQIASSVSLGGRQALALHLRPHFQAQQISLGDLLWQHGQVSFVGFVKAQASFQVEAADAEISHQVVIGYQQKKRRYSMSCDCKNFSSQKPCEHIWASILEVDELDLLPDVVSGEFADVTADQLLEIKTRNYNLAESSEGSDLNGQASAVQSQDAKAIQAKLNWRDSVDQAQLHVRREIDYKIFRKGGEAKTTAQARRLGTYVIDLDQSMQRGQIFIHLFMQERLKSGQVGIVRHAELNTQKISLYEDPLEREFLWDLLGRTEPYTSSLSGGINRQRTDSILIAPGQADRLLRKITERERLAVVEKTQGRSFGIDRSKIRPYEYLKNVFHLQLQLKSISDAEDSDFQLNGFLADEGGEHKSLQDVIGFVEHFVFFQGAMVRSDLSQFQTWYQALKSGPLTVKSEELNEFLQFYFSQIVLPPIDLPEAINFQESHGVKPEVQLTFALLKDSSQFSVQFRFKYLSQLVSYGSGSFVYFLEQRQKLRRDLEKEQEAHQLFESLNLRPTEDPDFEGILDADQFVAAAEKAIHWGWGVQAQEQKLKLGGNFKFNVTSGVDWFDLEAEFQFGDKKVGLPQLIHALRTGRRTIALGDGTTGLLPNAWFERFLPILGMARLTETGIRLNRVQALFWSAGLEEHIQLKADKKFESLMGLIQKLRQLDNKTPSDDFKGELRSYQQQGLAWLELLSSNELGGVLADDMGLGKTIQVLALLSEHYAKVGVVKKKTAKTKSSGAKEGGSHRPTLVIAPKSLLFNWQNEIKKFTPHIRVLNYSGAERQSLSEQFAENDIVLTTYHTLRNDIETFKDVSFEWIVFDEAHNVKNPQAQISMCCRMLQANKKFALTGTPIENSLMDLFSLLAIVIPGLVSDSQAQRWIKETQPEVLAKLAKALSPFLLRREKKQVLKDLPEKSEQILYCELNAREQQKYNELKEYYWGQLKQRIEEQGLAQSKIQVLEALLRLRQASCHQGLLDARMAEESSSKFELVLDQLEQVVKDGHKALVFSQFTSLLSLFRKELEKRNVQYEYLDGQTVNREERVSNFQNNPDCAVFVLSLKAGGVGLNLTAADYVFILDPWWNPAAESQAIDRCHRIGQDRKVFAYRIIAKNTVEEKILAMQAHKRELAKAVVAAETNLLRSLKVDDLQELFK